MICFKQIWKYLACALTFVTVPLWGNSELPMLPATVAVQGLSLNIDPQQTVYDSNTGFSGVGTMYFPALGRALPVAYANVRLDAQAHWQSGNVKATIAPDLLQASAISDLAHPKFVDNFDGLKHFIKTARSHENELPLMLNTLPSYQNADFGTLAVMITEINVSKERTTASMMALERMPEGIYLPFTRTDVAFDPLNPQPFKEMQLDLTATADITDVQLPITFKAGDATGTTGTYVTFDCNGLKVFHVEGFHKFASDIITPSPASGPDVIATFSADVKSLRQFVIKVTIPKFTIARVEDVAFEINDAMIDYSDSENPTTFPASYFTEMGDPAPTKKETWKGIHIGNVAISLPTLPMKDKDDKPFAFKARDMIYDRGNGFSATFYVSTAGMADINVKGFRFSLDEFNLRLKKNSLQDLNFLGGMAVPVLQDDKGALKYKATFNANATKDQPKLEFAIQLKNDITLEVPLLSLAKCQLKKTSVVKMQNRDGRWSVFANLQGSFDVGIKSPRLSVGLPFEGWKFGDNLTGAVTGAEELPMSFKAFDLDGGSDSGFGSSGDSGLGSSGGGGSSGGKKKLSGFPLTIDSIKFTSVKGIYELGLGVGVALGSGTSAFEAKGKITIQSKLNFAKLISKKPWEGITFKDVYVDSLGVDADMSAFIFKGEIVFMRNDPVYGDGFKANDLSFRVKGTPGGKSFSLTAKAIFGNIDNYNYFSVDADVTFDKGGIPFIMPLYLNKFGGGVYFNMQQVRDGNGPTRYVPQKGIMGLKARVGVGLQKRETFDALGEIIIEFGNDWAFRSLTLNVTSGVLNDVASINPSSDNPYRNSKIVGNCTIIYDNVNQTLTANMSVRLQNMMVKGNGSLSMFFNLNDSKDWYVRLGTPQTPIRVRWSPVEVGMYIMVGKGIGSLPNIGDVVPELRSMGLAKVSRLNPAKNESNTGSGFAFGLNYSMRQDFKFLIFSGGIKAAFGIDALLRDGACNGTGWNGWVMEGQAYAYVGAKVDIKVNLLFVKGTYNIAKVELGAVLQAKLPAPLYLSGKLAGRYSILNGLVSGKFRVEFEYSQGGEPCIKQKERVNPAVGQLIVSETFPDNKDEIQVFDDIVVSTNLEIRGAQTYEFEDNEGNVTRHFYKCRLIQVDVMQGSTKLATMQQGKFKDDNTFVITPLSALPAKTELELVIKAEAYDTDVNGNTLKTVGDETRIVKFRTGPRPEKVYNPMIFYAAPGTDQKYWYKEYARPKVTLKQNGYEYLFNPKPNGIESEYKWLLYKKVGKDSTLQGTYDLSATFQGTEVLNYEQENGAKCGYSSYTKQEIVQYIEMSYARIPIYAPKTYYTPNTCKYTETVPSRSFRFESLNNLTLDKGATYRIEVIRRPIKAQQKTETTTNVKETTETEVKTEDDDQIETTVQTRSLSVKKGSFQEVAILYTNVFGTSQFNDVADKIAISNNVYGEGVNGLGQKNIYSTDNLEGNLSGISGFRPYLKVVGTKEPLDKYDVERVAANSTLQTNSGWEFQTTIQGRYSTLWYVNNYQFNLMVNSAPDMGSGYDKWTSQKVFYASMDNFIRAGTDVDLVMNSVNVQWARSEMMIISARNIYLNIGNSCTNRYPPYRPFGGYDLNEPPRNSCAQAGRYTSFFHDWFTTIRRYWRHRNGTVYTSLDWYEQMYGPYEQVQVDGSRIAYNPGNDPISGTLNYTIPKTVPEFFNSPPTGTGGTVKKYDFRFTPPARTPKEWQ
jgi:hypothetical protein